jgi:predicted XRE-type DNA-binding protein
MSFRKVNNITEFDNLVKSFVANRRILKSNIDGIPLSQEQQEAKTLASQIEQKVEKQLKQQALTQKPTTDALALVQSKISDLTNTVTDTRKQLEGESKTNGVTFAADAKQTEVRQYKVNGDISDHLGRLGVNGIINTDELANNKVIVYKNSDLENNESWQLTDGLRYLLLNSYSTLERLSKQQRTIIEKSDVETYYSILKYAGIDAKAHQNKKIKMIKQILGLTKLDTVKNTKRIRKYRSPTKPKQPKPQVDDEVKTIRIKKQTGNGIVLTSVNDAISKLQVLVGSQLGGNNSNALKNQINSVMDYLLTQNAIDKEEHKMMHESYCK